MRTYQSSPLRRDRLLRGDQLPSRIFICVECGEAFARVRAEGDFMAYHGVCEACPPRWWTIPGSVLDELRPDFNASLPHEAWLWEVELHCRWAEKGEV